MRTDLARYLFDSEKASNNPFAKLTMKAVALFTRDVSKGADTHVWLAAGNGLEVGGKFYVDMKARVLGDQARDGGMARRLWEESGRIVGEILEGGEG